MDRARPRRHARGWMTPVSRARSAPLLPILLMAFAAVTPMLLRGCSCGHDFDFHLVSWMEAARNWQQGTWYPHWVQSANYGAGEPRLVFYPPASWMLGALLGWLAGWSAAPILFVFLSLAGCGVGMFALAREWAPRDAALCVACLYIANPYLMFVIYERSAFGELLAAAWMPAVVLQALRTKPSVARLAMPVAAVWLCNAPAGVMASYTLAILAAVRCVQERSARPAVRAGSGLALGLLLAAFYIVPAAWQQRWVQIERVIAPGMRVQDSFLFAHTSDAAHDRVLWTASWIVVAELGAAAVAAWSLLHRKQAAERGVVVAFAGLLCAIFLLQLRISDWIWSYAPHLKYLQFPWRWLLVASVALCALAGMAVSWEWAQAQWLLRTAAAACVVGMMLAGALLFFQRCDDEDAVAGQVASFNAAGGVEGTDEYTPIGADTSAIQQALPRVRVLRSAKADAAEDTEENPEWRPEPGASAPAQIRIDRWDTEEKSVQIRSAGDAFAVLRLMDYPSWQVRLNGLEVKQRPHRADGLIVVPLEGNGAGGEQQIDVRWVTTKDVVLGRGLSAAGLAALLLMALAERKKARRGRVS